MFDRGFGSDIRKFLGPLKSRALKPNGQGFQTILVTATMTKVCRFSLLLCWHSCYTLFLKLSFCFCSQNVIIYLYNIYS